MSEIKDGIVTKADALAYPGDPNAQLIAISAAMYAAQHELLIQDNTYRRRGIIAIADELISDIRGRVEITNTVERNTKDAWVGTVPEWATYFQGYRDALGHIVAWLENKK